MPTTTLVRPVRPPSEIPVEDSTKVVTVEVPRHAPTTVAQASATRALSPCGRLPSLSSMPALLAVPISVPTGIEAIAHCKGDDRRNDRQHTVREQTAEIKLEQRRRERDRVFGKRRRRVGQTHRNADQGGCNDADEHRALDLPRHQHAGDQNADQRERRTAGQNRAQIGKVGADDNAVNRSYRR